MDERLIKKPPLIGTRTSKDGYEVTDYKCPSCGKRMLSTKNGSASGDREKFCSECGQAMAWKGVKIETYWIPDEMD